MDNKLRGAYGETDIEKKVIKVNKKAHKDKKDNSWNKWVPKRDRTLLNTIRHEINHAQHPRMHEKNIRKLTTRQEKTMSKKQKVKLYKLF